MHAQAVMGSCERDIMGLESLAVSTRVTKASVDSFGFGIG